MWIADYSTSSLSSESIFPQPSDGGNLRRKVAVNPAANSTDKQIREKILLLNRKKNFTPDLFIDSISINIIFFSSNRMEKTISWRGCREHGNQPRKGAYQLKKRLIFSLYSEGVWFSSKAMATAAMSSRPSIGSNLTILAGKCMGSC